jgi:exonuclease III
MTLPIGINKDIQIVSLNVGCLGNSVSKAGLRHFLRHHQPDVVCLQECNVDSDELCTVVQAEYYTGVSNIAVEEENPRGTAIIWKSSLVVENTRIIEVNRVMSIQVAGLRIINVYAPSGRSKRLERRILFEQVLLPAVQESLPELPVVVGDFNCILSNIDAANNPQQKKCEVLARLMSSFDYVDIFRSFYPNLSLYTFIRPNSASRLDRIYVPQYLVQSCDLPEIIPAAFSDHSAVTVSLTVTGVQHAEVRRRSKSYWKLNNSILDHDDFMDNFRDLYQRVKTTTSDYDDIADWWEKGAKPMFQTFLKQFSYHVARESRDTKNALYIFLGEALSQGMAGYAESQELKHRIKEILAHEAEGVKIRSRYKENLEKERASLFHLSREKKRGKENNVEKLMINGVEVDDPKVCERAVLGFYEPLLNGCQGRITPFQIDRLALQEFLTPDIGRLSDPERDSLDVPFDMEELLDCVKSLPYNKSPGLDGLSNEFYKKVFSIIKIEYLEVQLQMVRRGYMNPSMRTGVTRLAPKVDDTPQVDQLRPITMLCVDYNIRSRMITRRMSGSMESIIKSGQLCSNKKRNILTGVHNLLSSIQYINDKDMSAALVSFDMDKAFDRCFIPYVIEVMRHMNFSEEFLELIKDMHHNVSTRFILNKLTDPISLTFSIRQGDPSAMLLYIIYMEPFLMSLKRLCEGVKIAGFKQIDEDYADDVEVLLEGDHDFILVNDLFTRFERCSGAVLSRTKKSKVLGLGGWKDRQAWPLPWLKVEKEIKVFGFLFLPTYTEILDRNWEALVKTVSSTVHSYSLRSLNTLQQRTDVLNIFVFSRIWYKCQALPLPDRVAKKLEQIAHKFLWRGKLEKLALQELHCSRDTGGLGLVEIRSKADALFVKQTCRILADKEGLGRMHLGYWVGLYLGNMFPDLRSGPHGERTPPYYVHLRRLLEEMVDLELVDIENLEAVQVKMVYRGLTETLPPPKVELKYPLPWDIVWERINHPLLTLYQREVMFMLVHNILPSKERLQRLNQADTAQCLLGDGEETVEHLFCSCRRVQVAWAWMRRKILNKSLALPTVSNFELLNLVSGVRENQLDFIWLISTYVEYVWKIKLDKKDYYLDLDLFQLHVSMMHRLNQISQNKVSLDLFN